MSFSNNTLIQITNQGMGHGDAVLADNLIKNYFKLLIEDDHIPKIIVFYNSGVKLMVEGSACLETLESLQEKGVKLVACTTCLNHFEIKDKLMVGQCGTMHDIIELQTKADKVVTL